MTVSIPTSEFADKPHGAPFVVGSCPFRPGGQLELSELRLDEDRVVNWPMVYILANDNSAYVGQTTSVATRINQHGASEEKSKFTRVNVIYNEEFNASVVTDYEHRLIGYMHADGRYKLTNKNDGMTDTNYFGKSVYSAMFEELWEELKRLELADHSISEIEEFEVFKYSPFKGLTTDQRVALDKILEAIGRGLDNAEPIVVKGMPGTGKTILAVFLLKTLKDNPKYADLNIKIIEPPTSLRDTLRESLKNVSNLSKDDVIGPGDLVKQKYGFKPGGKCFDIVLVDEAHRLHERKNIVNYGGHDKVNEELGLPSDASQLDWVLNQAKLPILFYDSLQVIGPSGISELQMRARLGDAMKDPIVLDSQMRVRGGKGYLDHIREVLNGVAMSKQTFDNYEFVIHDSFDDFDASFEAHFAKHDLTRMIAGYAWPWNTKKDKSPGAFDLMIDGIPKRWNCRTENWVGLGVNNTGIAHEVGCIHSIQGYDLSYAYVIIGEDLGFDEETGGLRANGDNYYDRNGKNNATQSDLNQYIKNIYYVLLTRGIYGTHVYVVDKKLREYFHRYF